MKSFEYIYVNTIIGFYSRKKRLESKLRRKYVLNLLNEPQNLDKIKILKLLQIPKKGVTSLRKRKLKLKLNPAKTNLK